MKTIQLTKGQVTLIDDEDFDYLNRWKWKGLKAKDGFYAVRSTYNTNSKKSNITLYMHRVILGLTDPKIFGDHIDHNKLNNQKNNLRIATPSQNMQNSKSRKNSSSQYLGVWWSKHHKKWKSNIKEAGRTKHLGGYLNEEDAARAYDKAAIELHGEFANLNFK